MCIDSSQVKLMTTHFITAEIDLQESPVKLNAEIQIKLEQSGKPLRWAVTKIDRHQQTATVEAIVTKESITQTS
jgi:hypothetical protein